MSKSELVLENEGKDLVLLPSVFVDPWQVRGLLGVLNYAIVHSCRPFIESCNIFASYLPKEMRVFHG